MMLPWVQEAFDRGLFGPANNQLSINTAREFMYVGSAFPMSRGVAVKADSLGCQYCGRRKSQTATCEGCGAPK